MYASGSRTQLLYIAETVFGTTPATPTMTVLRRTGSTLEVDRTSLQSAAIRSDRQTDDFRLGTKQAKGDIDVELVYGDYDSFLEAALGGTWTAEAAGTPNTLKAGTTKRSFSIETGFIDISEYFLYKGMFIDTLDLDVKPSAITTMKLGFMGQGYSAATSTSDSATPTAASTNSPMDSFTGIVTEGGGSIAYVTGITMNLKNNDDVAMVIGNESMIDYFPGRIDITGEMTAFFPDATLLNKFLNETESALTFTLQGVPTNKTLEFNLPRIKYVSGAVPVSSEKGLVQTLKFQALRDSGTSSNIVITRSNPV